MELRDYLRILRRRWPLILACLVLTVAAAAVLTLRATPQYESTARLFISTSSRDTGEAYQGGLFSTQRVQSYADLATGEDLADRVIDDLGLDSNAGELAKRVTAEAVPETVLLELSVTDPDPEMARLLAQTFAEELQDVVAELETPPGRNNPVLKATIVDGAKEPTVPVSPQPLRNLGLAAVLGLLLGFGLAVLREMLDTTVKSADDVAQATDAPIMAGIAYDPATKQKPLVTSLRSHEPRVEAFRVLRTNLQFVDIDSASKAFVVTSSVPAEGKSTSAVNIAIAMAQAGHSVCLLDGDLRRPQMARLLELEDSVGVTTVLLGKIGLDDAIQKHEASDLHVLASGAIPPNPAELLQSQHMADLLAELRRRYSTIVIDAPPLLPVTDAALLAAQTDGALLVVRHGKTTRDQLSGAHERLASVGAKPLGVVLNMVPRKRGGAYGYGYGYGYGYAPEEAKAGARRR